MKPFTADTLAARIKELDHRKEGSDGWASDAPALERALGRWDLTAIGVNQVIGSAIFLLPSDVAAAGRTVGPAGVHGGRTAVAVDRAVLRGSRQPLRNAPADRTLPARAAFGRFVGFEVGWMMWFTRVTSQASVANGLTLALAFYWPALATGAPRDGD